MSLQTYTDYILYWGILRKTIIVSQFSFSTYWLF